jgi:radical SAM superfamily enzyme YgiQ (UPF0313 family)
MRVLWPIYNLQEEHSQYPGVMSISALLKQEGFNVEVAPAELEIICSKLQEDPQTVLAFSTMTVHARHYLDLNAAIKKDFPDVVSVFGGPHPTFFPEMINETGVDAVCIGEGEYPMLHMMTNIRDGLPIQEVDNWWVKEESKIHKNPLRQLIENLDELPIPDHGLFGLKSNNAVSQAIVMTSRGCPYKCTYCYNHIYHDLYRGKGKPVRRRSVDHVIRELRILKENGCQYIRFMDDLFILFPDWLKEFATKYREQIGLPFTCLARANLVNEDIAKTLKEAGCYRVMLGLEAGNDHVRHDILNRKMSKDVIVRACHLIRENGMKLVTANIIGIPGGSFETDWETVELNLKCRPNYASAAILTPFPGTKIYDFALQEGMIDQSTHGDVEKSCGFGYQSTLKYEDQKEKQKIENLHKFFPLIVRLPFLAPLAKQLVKLPPNRLFGLLYIAMVNYGMYTQSVPMKVGIPTFLRRIRLYRWISRKLGATA